MLSESSQRYPDIYVYFLSGSLGEPIQIRYHSVVWLPVCAVKIQSDAFDSDCMENNCMWKSHIAASYFWTGNSQAGP